MILNGKGGLKVSSKYIEDIIRFTMVPNRIILRSISDVRSAFRKGDSK